jgi:quercetin dioxygenase-like cupin family protein
MRTISILFAAALLGACGARECPSAAPQESAGGEAPAEVRALADAPRRTSPPGTATIALLAQGANAFIGRLEMEPGAAVPEHQDPDEEYVVILEGHGTITIDGTTHDVQPGSTIFMPAGATVSYQNGDARLVAIQVFAGPGSASKYDRWTPLEDR